MADITDGLGRVSSGNADFESLKKGLESVVKKTMDFVAENREKSASDYDKLAASLSKLDGTLGESIRSTKEFISRVEGVFKDVSKKKEAPQKSSNEEKMEELAKKQLKVLRAMLKEHQSASSSVGITGPTGAAKRAKTYGPKGRDTVAAYLEPGEHVIPRKVAEKGAFVSPTKTLAAARGGVIKRGGAISPQYLAKGTGNITVTGAILDFLAGAEKGTNDLIVEAHLDGSHLSEEAKKEADEAKKIMNDRLKDISARMTAISTQLMGGHKLADQMFGGVIDDAFKFRGELRGIAFQTQGITGNMREMQATFSDVGKNVVAETGKSLSALKEALIKNSKKGMGKGGMDAMKSTLKSGLHLSTMIGSETQATADLFGDWHRQLSLSSNQMEVMARSMRSVALSTGVTGDELLESMKASQGILKNMRNAGTLTAGSAKNVITMMAEARKTGDEEKTSELLTAMSSFKDMQNASDKNKALLFTITNSMDKKVGNSRATEDMTFGTFATKRSNLKGMQTEILGILQGLNSSITSIEDINKLSDDQKSLLNAQLQSGYDTTIKGMESLYKQTEITSGGLAGQIAEQEKLLKKRYATEEEKMLAQKKMSDAYSGSALDYLSAIREKSSDMPLPEIFAEMEKGGSQFADLNEDFLALAGALDAGMKSKFGISGDANQQRAQMQSLSGQQKMQLSASVAADQLMQAAKRQGKTAKDFSAAAMNIKDNEGFNKFNEELQAEFKKLGIDEATKVDPMTEMTQAMLKLNETLRGFASPLIGGLLDLVGGVGILMAAIALNTGALYVAYGQGMMKLLRAIKGGGGKSGALAGVVNGTKAFSSGVSRATKSFSTGFSRARAAGNSFFSSLKRGFSGAMKSNKLTRGVPAAMSKGVSAVSRFGGAFSKGFTRSMKQGVPVIQSFGKGLNYAMKSTSATRGLLRSLSSTVSSINGKYVQGLASLHKASPALAGFVRNSVNMGRSFATLKFGETMTHFGRSMRSGFRVFKNVFNPASWKALPGVISMGFKGAKAAIVGGSLGTAQIIFSAIDMVFGAVTGYMNTGKNFEGVMKAMGKTTADMTWGMYASSTIAGALVGILDGLTFGLLSMTGAAEWLNQVLSKLIYLSYSFYEGIVSGIWAALQMVWSALKYLGKQFEGIGNSLLEIFNSIAGLFGAEAGNWSEAFAMIYPWLKRIGMVLGFILGSPIVAFLWLLVKAISLVLVPLQMLLAAIAGVFKILRGFVKFFYDIFEVGIWQAFKNLGWTIMEAVYGVFKPVVDFIWSLGEDIIAPFRWLYNILVGNSIVPDLCSAVVNFFGNMASNALKFVGNMVGGTVKFFAGLPGRTAGWLHKTFVKGPTKIFNKMLKVLNTKTLKAGLGVISEKFSTFFSLFKSNLKGLTGFFTSSWGSFLNTATGGLFGKVVNAIKNSGIASLVDDFLIKPIANGLSWLGTKASEVFSWAGKRAREVFGPAFSWMKGQFSRLMPKASAAADAATKAAQKGVAKVAEKTGVKAAMDASKLKRFEEFKRLRATGLSAADAKAQMGSRGSAMMKDLTGRANNAIKGVAKKGAEAAAKVAEKTGIKGAMDASKLKRFEEFKRLRATGLSAADAKAQMGSRGSAMMKDLTGKANDAIKGVAKKGTEAAAKVAEKTGIKGAMDKARFDEFKRLRATGLSAADAKAQMGSRGSTLMKSVAGKFGGKGGEKAVSAAAGSVDDLAKAAPTALNFLGKSSGLIKGLARKLPVVGPLIDFGMRKVQGQSTGKALVGTAAGAGGGLAGAAAGAAIGTMIFPGVGTAIGGLLGGLIGGIGSGMASDAVYDKVVGTGSGSSVKKAAKPKPTEAKSLERSLGVTEAELAGTQRAIDAASRGLEERSLSLATPVGRHAVPVAREGEDVSGVQPVHLRDISQTMLRERASTQAGNRQLRSDELTRIQEASDQQVYELQQIREGIDSLVEYMKPSGVLGSSEMKTGSTKDPKRPVHAALYGHRKYSEPGGTAARSLVNDGDS